MNRICVIRNEFMTLLMLVIAIMIAAAFAVPAQADSLTESGVTDYLGFSIHDYTFVMDSGSASAEATTAAINGIVIMVETDPGATAPLDNYDLTITDALGADIMGGALANRDTANTERAYPLSSTTIVEAPVSSILTFNCAAGSNTTKNATVRILVYTKDEKKGTLHW